MAEKKTDWRSKAGIELPDEVLERVAQETDAGLDVSTLRRRPGRPARGSGPGEAAVPGGIGATRPVTARWSARA